MKPASGSAVVRRRLQTPPPQNPEQKTNPRRTKVEEKGPHYHTHPNMADTGVHQPAGAAPASAGRGGRREGEASPVPAGRRPGSAATMQRPGGRRSSSPSSLPLSSAQPSPNPPHPATAAPWPRSRRHKAGMGHDIPDRRGSPLLPAGHPRTARHGDGPRPLSTHTHPPTATRATHI